MNGLSLIDRIVSETNIYNAIFALRSYVFEKGLLSKEDVILYNRLADKYDFETIGDVIRTCQNRITDILSSEKLFNIQVYFKLKKFGEESGRFEFRPIHTASLIDQICMVSMLMPLMFDDSNETRKLSEVSKLIPHNFYGNIPAIHVDDIFEKWQGKYKRYSEDIVRKSREFKESKQFQYEVGLDLKDFFPSIDPAYIFSLIREKMKLVVAESDHPLLELVLTKLLFFHIDKANLRGWEKDYYRQDIKVDRYASLTNKGIAQGLPQAYFFGNLMMLRISGMVGEEFEGEAFYYVDDSVLFTNGLKDDAFFEKKIRKINEKLRTIDNEYDRGHAYHLLCEDDRELQIAIKYGPQYYEEGKSFFVDIDDAYSGSGGLQYITRQVSLAGSFANNLDDIDDEMSREKLQAVLQVIDNEIASEKRQVNNGGEESKLKLLKRHKRYFLYRYRLLCLREQGDITENTIKEFEERYRIKEELVGKELLEVIDEEIFQYEGRLIVGRADAAQAKEFIDSITRFETTLAMQPGREYAFLYYRKDLEGTLLLRDAELGKYKSLDKWCRRTYGNYVMTSAENQRAQIAEFLAKWRKRWTVDERFLPFYTEFVMKNSNEFVRRVMNAFFSTLFVVDVTDRHAFIKNNNRGVNYLELRFLAYLRNLQFKTIEFERFAEDVLKSEPKLENASIDMALMDVLHILISTVKNPGYVDSLILTHRLVNGLWKNGSKFLNAYTLHNEEHAITLIKQCVKLLKVIDYIGIKQDDYYVLFLACYLHDISMVIHPQMGDFNLGGIGAEKIVSKAMSKFLRLNKRDLKAYHDSFRNYLLEVFSDVYEFFEKEKRDNHPKESADYIRQQQAGFLHYIEKSILEMVAVVSESHGYDTMEVYGLKSTAKDSLYSIKYMMILIRLADLMDMTSARVSYYRLRQNMDSMSPVSRFHWISHLITDNAYITARYVVDSKKRLYEQPVTETIRVVIQLNVNYSAAIKPKDICSGCQATHFTSSPNKASGEVRKTVLEIIEKDHVCSCYASGSCPIICAWMSNKNFYLRKELVVLKNYLNQANSKLFNTRIEIDLQYQDAGNPLDNDMFDSVYSFLTLPKDRRLAP